MDELTFLAVVILGLTGIGVVHRYVRGRHRLRLHEMAHRERVLALEKGLPVADVPAEVDADTWVDESWSHRVFEAGWDRRIALAIGLVTVFAGLGALALAVLLPAYDEASRDAKLVASLGAIPLMGGIGLLLYYRLTAPRHE